MSKTLLLDLRTLGIPLDNVEGMTMGPDLPDGRKSLILVSDNFSGQFVGSTCRGLSKSCQKPAQQLTRGC